ncbi:MAG: hypothetical protein KQ78_01814 [Candidatus Izimaplasma bacterium HR2]|nr:MAG: hypothetical protein KQ78_01814 [Candidatus Izimaplasma bacterium HR2]
MNKKMEFLKKIGVFRVKESPKHNYHLMYNYRLWHPLTILLIIITFPINIFCEGIFDAIEDVKDLKRLYYWENKYK